MTLHPSLRHAALLALALTIAFALTTVTGCRTTHAEKKTEQEIPVSEIRAELIREMRAGGATPAQIREMERQLDALARQMRKLERELKRVEKASE